MTPEIEANIDQPKSFKLSRPDYDATRPVDEIEESYEIFEVEAQMSAIDFDDAERWRFKTKERTRTAFVEDTEFLGRVARGLPIRKSDIFTLTVRAESTTKNGRTRTDWIVLKVTGPKRGADDSDS